MGLPVGSGTLYPGTLYPAILYHGTLYPAFPGYKCCVNPLYLDGLKCLQSSTGTTLYTETLYPAFLCYYTLFIIKYEALYWYLHNSSPWLIYVFKLAIYIIINVTDSQYSKFTTFIVVFDWSRVAFPTFSPTHFTDETLQTLFARRHFTIIVRTRLTQICNNNNKRYCRDCGGTVLINVCRDKLLYIPHFNTPAIL